MNNFFVPRHFFLFSWLVLFSASFLFALYALKLDTLAAYFFSINLSAFVLFGHDKRISSGREYRMSERFQLALAVVGASPAILAGMVIFRHKIRKGRFRLLLPAILLLQGLLIWGFVLISL
jgi:uncharacterized membrane protein YsdA (DUF1294 family)